MNKTEITKKIAEELGIDIIDIKMTGPTKTDIAKIVASELGVNFIDLKTSK